MTRLADEVRSVSESLEIRSEGSFVLWGSHREARSAPPSDDFALHAAGRKALQGALYARLHCRILEGSSSDTYRDRGAAIDFVNRLSRANCGVGPWERGWVVRGLDGSDIVAERHGVRFWVTPDRFRQAGPESGEGSVGSVRIPREYRRWLPGFYWVNGDTEHPPEPDTVVRLYWNVTPGGGVHLTEVLTRVLNGDRVPFRFKTADHPGYYVRADSAVLYMPRKVYDEAFPLIEKIYEEVSVDVHPDVSVLVKALAPGLGLAEDRGDGGSFGLYCCGLIADALSHRESVGLAPAARCEHVFAHLRDRGLDPERPYLNPGEPDTYRPIASAATTPEHAGG